MARRLVWWHAEEEKVAECEKLACRGIAGVWQSKLAQMDSGGGGEKGQSAKLLLNDLAQ